MDGSARVLTSAAVAKVSSTALPEPNNDHRLCTEMVFISPLKIRHLISHPTKQL
jgi:hypothetical protein